MTKKSTVDGYDPEVYREMYYGAEGSTSNEKINSIRRAQREKNKKLVNAQQREAYHARKAREASGAKTITLRAARGDVTIEYIKAAKPGTGKVTLDNGYKESKHRKEIKTAQWLHDNIGGDIVLLQESGGLYEKTPDYLWNNLAWELKTVTTEKSADSALRSALKQIAENPGGVILDYGDNDISIDTLQKVIDGRLGRQKTCSADIMVLNHDQLIRVIRYKK